MSPIQQYKLASREYQPTLTSITIKQSVIGPEAFTVIAGPCAIESEEQIFKIAKLMADSGVTILRGGAFKPRTSPYSFQGLGKKGLFYLQQACMRYGLLSVSEVMDSNDIDVVAEHVDILQVGSRNMQNFSLLKELGKIAKPILLKRGLSATYAEWLMAAEYILQAGNPQVILCERGIRTFETHTRNTLDLAAIPALRELTHLPIIIDPSHGTGLRHCVSPMALAAFAAGADGIMVEVHPQPEHALSDGGQSLTPALFMEMMKKLKELAPALNRRIA